VNGRQNATSRIGAFSYSESIFFVRGGGGFSCVLPGNHRDEDNYYHANRDLSDGTRSINLSSGAKTFLDDQYSSAGLKILVNIDRAPQHGSAIHHAA
jgi:hypothetical protein